jgi:hypothetical protein
MTQDEFRTIALSFPTAEEGFNMGSVVFKANGKVLARLLGGDRAMLVGMGFDERELMLEAEPEVFHITPHYRDFRGVIANLAPLDSAACRALIERRWREVMPKKALAAYDAGKQT